MSRQNSTTSKASAGATFASSKARSAAKSEADFGDEEDESESEDELDDEEEEEEEGNSEDEAFDIDDLSSENHTNSSSPSNLPEDPTSVVPPLPTNAVPAVVENPFATHALPPKPDVPGHAHASPPPPLHNFTLKDTLTSSAASSVAELNDDPRFRDPAPRPPRLSSRHSASAIPQTSMYSSSAPPGGAPSAGGGATRMSPAVARRRERGEEGDRDHLRESLSVKRSVGAGSGRRNRSKERSPRTPKVDEQKESGHGGNGGGFAFAVVGADSDTSVVRPVPSFLCRVVDRADTFSPSRRAIRMLFEREEEVCTCTAVCTRCRNCKQCACLPTFRGKRISVERSHERRAMQRLYCTTTLVQLLLPLLSLTQDTCSVRACQRVGRRDM